MSKQHPADYIFFYHTQKRYNLLNTQMHIYVQYDTVSFWSKVFYNINFKLCVPR